MRNVFNPFRFVVIAVAGWMNQKQQHAIDYLREENRVLKEQLGNRRLRFTDDQRRRLAAKAKLVGRRVLNEIADLVTPDTLLAWHRKLIAESMTAVPSVDPDGHAPPTKSRPSLSAWLKRIAIGDTGGFSVPCPTLVTASLAAPLPTF